MTSPPEPAPIEWVTSFDRGPMAARASTATHSTSAANAPASSSRRKSSANSIASAAVFPTIRSPPRRVESLGTNPRCP